MPGSAGSSPVEAAGIEEAINALRMKPGPLRVVDLGEELAARCRLLRVSCPSGMKVHRRSEAAPGNADPKIFPGSFNVQKPLDVVQIDHPPMDIIVVAGSVVVPLEDQK